MIYREEKTKENGVKVASWEGNFNKPAPGIMMEIDTIN